MASTREIRGALRKLRLQFRKPPGTIEKIEAIVRLDVIAEQLKRVEELLPHASTDETVLEVEWRNKRAPNLGARASHLNSGL